MKVALIISSCILAYQDANMLREYLMKYWQQTKQKEARLCGDSMKITLIVCFGLLALGSTASLPDPDACTGENEEMGWIGGCGEPDTCPRKFRPPICIPIPPRPACVCVPGYTRNYLGECITHQQCAQCSKPHEFFSCGSACDNECKNIKTQGRNNCPIINIVCNKRCYCEDGYARDNKGNCIPIDKCRQS